MFGFDDLPIEVLLVEDSEEDDDSVVGKLSCKLNFVISISTMFAGEGCEYDFSEEWNFGEEKGRDAIIFTIDTETLYCGG